MAHPLWRDYAKTQEQIKEIRPAAETGDVAVNNTLTDLEKRLTNLTMQIGKDLNLVTINPFSSSEN